MNKSNAVAVSVKPKCITKCKQITQAIKQIYT